MLMHKRLHPLLIVKPRPHLASPASPASLVYPEVFRQAPGSVALLMTPHEKIKSTDFHIGDCFSRSSRIENA